MGKEDPAQTALAVATARALARHKKKPLTFAVTKILKRNKFSPLSIFINQVFPMLEPKDQADALFKMMEFIYPKVQRADISGKKKGPGIQTNVQVNVPPNQPAQEKQLTASQPQLTLQELLSLAGDSQKD